MKLTGKNTYRFNFGIETFIYIAVSLSLGFLVPRFSERIFPDWFSPVSNSTMVSILSSVASGMITLSGIVFSLVFVLLQFGSASYSPRLSRIFVHSYVLRHSLGIFTGTFLYSLMAMRTLGIETSENSNSLVIWVAFGWLLASIIILASLINVFTKMTITNVLTSLGILGRLSINRVYGPYSQEENQIITVESVFSKRQSSGDTVQQIIYNGGPGYVNGYNKSQLLSLAQINDTIIYLPFSIGDALKDGAPIVIIQGKNPPILESRIYSSIEIGIERGFKYDPKYSFRLLVDTAIRALSPAINDPTTAVQVLDHIESLLQHIGNSDLNTGFLRDSHGDIRLVYKTPTWEDYLQLGLSEIMQYGAKSIQVERRLEALLLFLKQAIPSARADAVVHFSEQRNSLSSISFQNATFLKWANTPDREGIGSGSNVFDQIMAPQKNSLVV